MTTVPSHGLASGASEHRLCLLITTMPSNDYDYGTELIETYGIALLAVFVLRSNFA